MSRPSLILASKSPARRRVLENAGVPFEARDAGIYEDAIKAECAARGAAPQDVALSLAEAKARAVTDGLAIDALVIGCDQILVQDGRLFDKPRSMAEAHTHLQTFSGNSHQLISAICLACAGNVVWKHVEIADMHVRALSTAFIDAYLADEGERVLSSVGAYLLEGAGAQLFSRIDGDYFTVLGLPLLPLLEELRKRGILAA